MLNVLFVGGMGLALSALLAWAFRRLPQEEWQILATLPVRKRPGGWEGVNLTYYGVLTASSAVFAVCVFLLLMASIQVALGAALLAVGLVLLCCMPAAKLVARVVEGKQHTFTIAGAAFIGILIAPLLVAVLNFAAGTSVLPVGASVTAMVIAYAFGEGVGRLACISFGCCYGKPIDACNQRAQRWFERFHFAFRGATKKIAYSSDLEGVKVVPVQAFTAMLYVGAGLLGMALFLESEFRIAFVTTLVVSQTWRIYSETMRADYRGGGRISAYQVMALLGMLYGLIVALSWSTTSQPTADLAAGLAAFWNPLVIISLQAMWGVLFFFTGWSMVTGSVLSFHVHHDRI